MGKQRIKVISGPTRPDEEDGQGHTCPHCSKKRKGPCPHGENCPHRGKCKRHRQHAAHEDPEDMDPRPKPTPEEEPGEGSPLPPEGVEEHQPGPGNGEGGDNGHNGHVHNFIDIPPGQGPACEGPHCLNLTVLRELSRLNLGMGLLQRQERSLLRYLARMDHQTVEEFVLSLLLEPMFESIELAYGAADVLQYEMARDTTPGSPCPFASLINGLERRLELYVRMDEGLDAEAGEEMAELFDEKDISSAQILAGLSEDQGDETRMFN